MAEYEKLEFREEDFTSKGRKDMEIYFRVMRNYINNMGEGKSKISALKGLEGDLRRYRIEFFARENMKNKLSKVLN